MEAGKGFGALKVSRYSSVSSAAGGGGGGAGEWGVGAVVRNRGDSEYPCPSLRKGDDRRSSDRSSRLQKRGILTKL